MSFVKILGERGAYTVGLAREMERPPLELGEVFKENRHERCDIISRILCRSLPMVEVNQLIR